MIAFVKTGVSIAPWGNKSQCYIILGAFNVADSICSDKEAYFDRDIARWAHQMDIPWKPGRPDGFPATRTSDVATHFSTNMREKLTRAQVQRAVTACTIACSDKVGEIYDALFHAFWFEKKGVQLPEVYEPILKSVLGNELAEHVIEMVSVAIWASVEKLM